MNCLMYVHQCGHWYEWCLTDGVLDLLVLVRVTREPWWMSERWGNHCSVPLRAINNMYKQSARIPHQLKWSQKSLVWQTEYCTVTQKPIHVGPLFLLEARCTTESRAKCPTNRSTLPLRSLDCIWNSTDSRQSICKVLVWPDIAEAAFWKDWSASGIVAHLASRPYCCWKSMFPWLTQARMCKWFDHSIKSAQRRSTWTCDAVESERAVESFEGVWGGPTCL